MAAISSPVEEKVPLASRIWVSAADAACSMLNSFATAGALTYYFTRWRGLEANYAAWVWILFGIWNAVNDPLFGYISDRTKSILGRRVPYIRFGAPIYTLGFTLFWLVLPGVFSTQTGMFIQMLVSLFIFDSLYTAIATSVFVMPYEMAISNKARSSIYVWKIIFAVFPLAIPLILVPIIQPGPGEEAATFQTIMIIFGVAMGAVIFASTFFYREKHFQQTEEQFTFVQSLAACFKNRSFVIYEVLSFTVIYVQTGLMMGVLYYFDEIDVSAVPIYAALAVGIVAGVVTFVKMREKWGVKNSTRYMTLVFSLGAFVILLMGKMLLPAMVGMFCFGIGFSGGMYLIPLMMGDTVDADEERTGLRREGMYAGINSFVTKPAISLAQAAFLWILGIYGYDNALPKGAQPASAETGILVAWTLIPGILLFVSFLSLHWYPLDGPKWNEIKARLSASHEEKERRYLESL